MTLSSTVLMGGFRICEPAWGAIQRQADPVAIDDHGQFILRTGQGKSYACFAGQHRATRQFVEQTDDFVVVEPADGICIRDLRQRMAGFQKGHGTRAFPANRVEQRKVVLTRYL